MTAYKEFGNIPVVFAFLNTFLNDDNKDDSDDHNPAKQW